MGLLSKIFSNTKKPEGFFGKLMVNGMNGGGGNIARLLKRCPSGTVTGIDYSSVSVEKSKKVNSQAIQESRCKVVEGSVAVLPFEEK